MRVYETMIIFDREVEEDDVREHVERFHEIVEERGGAIRDTNYWGRRKFAYEINHKRDGYYVVILADVEPQAMDEAARVLAVTDAVVRHKTLRIPDSAKQLLGQSSS